MEMKPRHFQLKQNYPNPFNPKTTIHFVLPMKAFVSLKVYDVLGKEVTVLLKDECQPGENRVVLNGKDLATGVYYYVLKTETFSQARKMVLLR